MEGFLAVEESYIPDLRQASCVIAPGGSVVYNGDATVQSDETFSPRPLPPTLLKTPKR